MITKLTQMEEVLTQRDLKTRELETALEEMKSEESHHSNSLDSYKQELDSLQRYIELKEAAHQEKFPDAIVWTSMQELFKQLIKVSDVVASADEELAQ